MSRFELLSPERIASSPSSRDGISEKDENEMRREGCSFLRSLLVPLLFKKSYVIYTGCVFFHRFYSIQSYKSHDKYIVAAGCCFLAAKVEESFRKPEVIAKQFYSILKKREPDAAAVNDLKMKLLLCERIILNVLSFDLIVEQPYNAMLVLAEKLHMTDNSLQYAWRFANDSFFLSIDFLYSVLSTISIQYTETTIAAACIYLAILVLKTIPMEEAMPTLLTYCGVSEGVLINCANCIKLLYSPFEDLFKNK